jgi:NADH:ubiquinone oxidoreductase subunit F (NADH-binding)
MEKVLYRMENGQGKMSDIDLLADVAKKLKEIPSVRSAMPLPGQSMQPSDTSARSSSGT